MASVLIGTFFGFLLGQLKSEVFGKLILKLFYPSFKQDSIHIIHIQWRLPFIVFALLQNILTLKMSNVNEQHFDIRYAAEQLMKDEQQFNKKHNMNTNVTDSDSAFHSISNERASVVLDLKRMSHILTSQDIDSTLQIETKNNDMQKERSQKDKLISLFTNIVFVMVSHSHTMLKFYN